MAARVWSSMPPPSWPPANQIIDTGVPLAAMPRALASDWSRPNSVSRSPWTSSVGAVMSPITFAGDELSSSASSSGERTPVSAACKYAWHRSVASRPHSALVDPVPPVPLPPFAVPVPSAEPVPSAVPSAERVPSFPVAPVDPVPADGEAGATLASLLVAPFAPASTPPKALASAPPFPRPPRVIVVIRIDAQYRLNTPSCGPFESPEKFGNSASGRLFQVISGTAVSTLGSVPASINDSPPPYEPPITPTRGSPGASWMTSLRVAR